MSTNKTAAGLAIILLASSIRPASAQEVFIRVRSQEGRGLSLARGNLCFVVAPKHVTADADAAVSVVASTQFRTEAVVHREFADDVALLQTNANPTGLCSTWTPPRELAVLLGSGPSGTLRVREEDGSRRQIPVLVTRDGPEGFDVRAVDNRDVLTAGMSGSAVILKDSIAGMLVTVNTTTGEGRALRTDYIMNLLATYWAPNQARSDSAATILAPIFRQLASASSEGFDQYRGTHVTSLATMSFSWLVPEVPGFSNQPKTSGIPLGCTIADSQSRSQYGANRHRSLVCRSETDDKAATQELVELLRRMIQRETPSSWPLKASSGTYPDQSAFENLQGEICVQSATPSSDYSTLPSKKTTRDVSLRFTDSVRSTNATMFKGYSILLTISLSEDWNMQGGLLANCPR
jgi:hypothetical protein